MLNASVKKKALGDLEKAQTAYEALCETTQNKAEALFLVRQSSSHDVIPAVENYVNSLANTPKEFEKSFAAYKAEFTIFSNILHELEIASKEAAIKAGGSAAAGVAAGIGTAAFAPTAAMAIATTFGTASTGTAISTLSGAAATKAALAWLGGGALAKGGAGMAGGKALLALAGPIGWAVGSAAVVGGGLYARNRNGKIAAQATERLKEIQVHTHRMRAAKHEIEATLNLTNEHVDGLKTLLTQLKATAPDDYTQFDRQMRKWLGALVNHVQSLSKLLNKKVDVQ